MAEESKVEGLELIGKRKTEKMDIRKSNSKVSPSTLERNVETVKKVKSSNIFDMQKEQMVVAV